ncbi:Crp/Fnr family transcriptional regulator [Hoeflea sp. CAU 1731]
MISQILTEQDFMATKPSLKFEVEALLSKLDGGHSIAEHKKDSVIFSQGDLADAAFFIQRGNIRISVVSELGKEAIVALLGENEFFGEGCLAGQPNRISTATAMTDSYIVKLKKEAVVRLIHEDPEFSELFIVHLLSRAVRVEADLVDQLFNSSEKRLARTLLLLANFGQEGKPQPILATISQDALAQMVGTTRARVSFFMNKFRKLGFISYNGKIEVHSSLLNVILHDEPNVEH